MLTQLVLPHCFVYDVTERTEKSDKILFFFFMSRIPTHKLHQSNEHYNRLDIYAYVC